MQQYTSSLVTPHLPPLPPSGRHPHPGAAGAEELRPAGVQVRLHLQRSRDGHRRESGAGHLYAAGPRGDPTDP